MVYVRLVTLCLKLRIVAYFHFRNNYLFKGNKWLCGSGRVDPRLKSVKHTSRTS